MSRYDKVTTQIWNERLCFRFDPPIPLCDVCGLPLMGAVDPHHAIIRQGEAMGWHKEDRELIDHRYNIVLVHRDKCHLMAHADVQGMVAIQIVRYGWANINAWVKSLPFKVPFPWNEGLDDVNAKLIVIARYHHILDGSSAAE